MSDVKRYAVRAEGDGYITVLHEEVIGGPYVTYSDHAALLAKYEALWEITDEADHDDDCGGWSHNWQEKSYCADFDEDRCDCFKSKAEALRGDG